MTREEALRVAFELVEKMGNTEDLNKRGYKVDGWKAMTGTERAEATVKLAEFLVGPKVGLTAPEEATT